jgi:pectinesterase
MKQLLTILFIVVSLLHLPIAANAKHPLDRIVVDTSGKGDYKTIQGAINSLPDTAAQSRVIFIRKGVYAEKIYLEKHNITLLGEDREKTIITQAIARDEWRCIHNDDWGVATVNTDGNDITFQNLTITNSFGFDNRAAKIIPCSSDTITHQKKIAKNSHQMALRTMKSTRLKAINCRFRAFGGDTVSPWNVQEGLFYFKDCIMEGGVDFYCPRGWAWAENCHFIAHSGVAAIWHDGSVHEDSKTVLKNCTFEGFDGFNLGRYHRDAQFYLINCTFPQNMSDKDIYLVSTSNKLQWGRRVYYYNTHRQGGDYAWHKDNLHTAKGSPTINDITINWLYKGQWQPDIITKQIQPKAHVRLRKRNADSTYGPTLKKEIMPANHQANDFTKVRIPYYQTEGPAWENDKVGFRIYLDVRNGKDIFGKVTPALVMDTVGTYGDRYYHYFDPRWGMDLLKVGKSLGAGSLALQVTTTAGRDTLIRLGEHVGQTQYELVKDGADEAVFRLHYKNWKVLNHTYNLTEEISIRPGQYYYESKVTVNGLKGDEKLVTGIVNLKSKASYTVVSGNADVLYTHDLQSENNDHLGMAIRVDKKYKPVFGQTPNEGNGILNTYTATMDLKNNQPVVYQFYACWEQTDKRFADKTYFQNFLSAQGATTTKKSL